MTTPEQKAKDALRSVHPSDVSAQDGMLAQAHDPQTTPFDYIVVGSGAGGGTLAARLARGGCKVLVLEAGVDPALANAAPGNPLGPSTFNPTAWREVYQVPGYHAASTEDAAMSWEFSVRHYADDAQQARDGKYEASKDPSRNAGEGKGGIQYPRCAAIGGCTAHHAMITVKPNDQDWDAIAALTGDPGWRSETMQGYFARIEDCLYYQSYDTFFKKIFGGLYVLSRRIAEVINPRFQLDWGGHGFSGWLKTSFINPAQVLGIFRGDNVFRKLLLRVILHLQTRKGALSSLLRSIVRFQAVQYLDPNITTERQQAYAQLKFIPVSTDGSRRNGLREHLLRTANDCPEHLVLRGGAFVERVIFKDEGAVPRAVGVAVREGAHLYEASLAYREGAAGTPVQYYARREVILCGGAFNTPQVLMLSGIGPADELARLGIAGPCDADGQAVADPVHLPGVGRNLQDRYEVSVISETKQPFVTLKDVSFAPGDPNDPVRAQWLRDGGGLYATNGGAVAVLVTSDQAPKTAAGGAADPDLFIFGVPAAFRGYYWGWSKDLLRRIKGAPQEQRNLWSWVILKGYTTNRTGTVTLRSNEPFRQPDICFHSFTESDEGRQAYESDRAALADGVKLVRSLNVRADVFANEVQPGKAVKDDSVELGQWIENEAWGHHACGTCRMGSDRWQANTELLADRGAVLDSALRVHGVRGLRVADASVFPRIPGYFIVAPVLMVGEKAADLILDEAHTYPDALRNAEYDAIRRRRETALLESGPPVAAGPYQPEPKEPEGVVGLALSGGGIRSATFCLGVLQALASKGKLRGVDMLSTISGGSYIGSFLGRLFTRVSPNVADPSGRVQEQLSSSTSAPVWWLRRYANYIGGDGRSDFVNNLGVIWRNLLSVYVVLGALFLAVFAGLGWWSHGWEPLLVRGVEVSPWWWLPVATLGVWVVPSGLGFWLAARPGSVATLSAQALLGWFALIGAAISALALPGGLVPGLIATGVLLLACTWVEVVLWSVPTRTSPDARGVIVRNRLTQVLGTSLLFLLATVLWVLLDTLARRAAKADMMMPIGATTVGLAAITPFLRGLIEKLTEGKEGALAKLPDSLKQQVIAGAIAVPLIAFALFALDHLVHYVAISADGARIGAWMLAVAVFASLAFGRALGFLNLSSLHSAYAARLTRTFLGAANDERINSRNADTPTDVRNAHPGDDLAYSDYRPENRGGPLHLIGVTVNETVDAASGRETREDKGLSMCVGPAGVSVGVRYHALWSPQTATRPSWLKRLVRALLGLPKPAATNVPPQTALRALSAGTDPHAFHVLKDGEKESVDVEQLRLGQWMAISGAAFTPGLGRATSLPVALAFGLFNVRLGYWWNSGIDAGDRPGRYPPPLAKWLCELPARLFRTQSTILAEWRARFGGGSERLWYLSDGGHFENTGLYELIRRRLPLMIAVDGSHDPQYKFDDMALLTRRVRIDFNAAIDWLEPAVTKGTQVAWTDIDRAASRLGRTVPYWVRGWINPAAIGPRQDICRDGAQAAALGIITYTDEPGLTSWVLLVKATVGGEVPLDVSCYAATHEDFPHTSTAQQFFSDDEWEAYRMLGRCVGGRVFG